MIIIMKNNLSGTYNPMFNLYDHLLKRTKAPSHNLKVQNRQLHHKNSPKCMNDADNFLNAVVSVETELEPEALLDACLSVENQLGRVRTGVWAPRTIDLDVLAYANRSIQTERLQIPHPRITERDFVAQPLSEVAPGLVVFGKRIEAIVAALPSVDLKRMSESLRDA